MPIHMDRPIRILTQDEFRPIAFELMGHAFAIHNEMGRFFDERVYQNALLARFGDRAATEAFIHVAHADFWKSYRIDLLVDGGAAFEFKAVQQLHEQHRMQLIHYLMLTGLRHGKLINFRLEQVEHEFVNCSITAAQRHEFRVNLDQWNRATTGCADFQDWVLNFVHDWGAGLDLQLYEEAVAHRYGGLERVECDVEVVSHGNILGRQRCLLLDPTMAFRITTLRKDFAAYESHLRRFMEHTRLERFLWANISLGEVMLREVRRSK